MDKETMIKKYKMYLGYIQKEKELAEKAAGDFMDIAPNYTQQILSKVERIKAKITVAEEVLIDLGVPASEW